MQQQRPTGVTILAILAIIGGIFGLCGGGLGLLGGALGTAATGLAAQSGSTETAALAANTGILFALSIFLLVISVCYIIFGIGAFRLSPWAWTLGVAIGVVGIIADIASIVLTQSYVSNVIGIAIALVVLYYLFRPNVRAAFQRA